MGIHNAFISALKALGTIFGLAVTVFAVMYLMLAWHSIAATLLVIAFIVALCTLVPIKLLNDVIRLLKRT